MKKTKKYRVQCVHIDPELIEIADDIVSSIEKASWPLRHPTMHMLLAMNTLADYKAKATTSIVTSSPFAKAS